METIFLLTDLGDYVLLAESPIKKWSRCNPFLPYLIFNYPMNHSFNTQSQILTYKLRIIIFIKLYLCVKK